MTSQIWTHLRTGLAIAAVSMLAAGGARAQDLVYGSWLPQAEYTNSTALPKIFKQIEEETKGAIKWKLVPGGQLANPKTTFDNVQNKVMAAGIGIASYVPNVIPATGTIYGTVQFGNDTVAASGAALETLTLGCPQCLAEFRKINMVPLSGWTTSAYRLACRSPVASLADLKGKRVRATGVGSTDLIAMSGAVPVNATLTEAVGLLQKGGIECTFGVDYWLKSFGYADFAKHITDYHLGMTGPAIGLMINRDVWSAMSREHKIIHLRKAAILSADQAIEQFIVNNEAALKDVMTNKGVKLVPAKADDFAGLVKQFDPQQRKKNIEAAEKFGVKDPGQIIDTYNKNVEKWKKISAAVGRDSAKLAEAYWTEIYSKVDPDKHY